MAQPGLDGIRVQPYPVGLPAGLVPAPRIVKVAAPVAAGVATTTATAAKKSATSRAASRARTGHHAKMKHAR